MAAVTKNSTQQLATPIEVIHHVFMRGKWPSPVATLNSVLPQTQASTAKSTDEADGFVELPVRTRKVFEVLNAPQEGLLARVHRDEAEPPAKRMKSTCDSNTFESSAPGGPAQRRKPESQEVVVIGDLDEGEQADQDVSMDTEVASAGETPGTGAPASVRQATLRGRLPQGEVSSMKEWLALSSKRLKDSS
mmetsp:Transcript_32920/g.60237  ORF Transcript_32920/g.60237 Transcript_32920/m.60237 type:complete len:191 (+) Transcript_32920:96-668(+)